MTNALTRRVRLLGCSAIATATLLPTATWAQSAASNGGLEEIVVTAQKREQSMQDVPIAVTAVTQENLQANRIYTVNDLSAVAPGLTVKPSAGGIQVPAFTMRGQVSFGVVAGSDKQVSIYLDGVYLSNPRGSIFDLPDIARLEVLRGPQGTLFGRNATAGAISITTRDPSGHAHMKVEGTYGNYDAYRVRATVDTPQFGPFSAMFTFVRNYRRGEIENADAGVVWDRTKSTDRYWATKAVSPKWLGTVDTYSYFGALKFEPTDNFKMVYKFDHNDDHGTPEGTGIVAINPNFLGGALGPQADAIYASFPATHNLYITPSAKRPDTVTNGWVIPRDEHVEGHSLTATWKATDNITVKNVAAFRKARIFGVSTIDGISSLTVTPADARAIGNWLVLVTPPAFGGFAGNAAGFFALPQAQQNAIADAFGSRNLGQQALFIASASSSISKQYSDELQINYSSERLQATLGALWFHSVDESGGPEGLQNTSSLFGLLAGTTTNGVIQPGNEGRTFNQATSLAAYAQLEYKITPQLEIVAGARITHDKKDSQFRWDINGVSQPVIPGPYRSTKPNFLVGLNYKPNPDTLLYAKWSNSFVSGGSVAGLTYAPETASSWEVGAKADFLDHKLRANLALYYVDYKHLQQSASTNFPPTDTIAISLLTQLYGSTIATNLANALSTYVLDTGSLRAKGFELEVTAAPTRGLTMGTSVGFTDASFPFVLPVVLAGTGGRYDITARPKWTVNLFASYETQPLFGDATLSFRMDGQYRSKIQQFLNPGVGAPGGTYPDLSNANAASINGFMLVNGRIALKHLKIGPADAELAFWGKNITNRKEATFILNAGYTTSANYTQPRTYGVDLSIDF